MLRGESFWLHFTLVYHYSQVVSEGLYIIGTDGALALTHLQINMLAFGCTWRFMYHFPSGSSSEGSVSIFDDTKCPLRWKAPSPYRDKDGSLTGRGSLEYYCSGATGLLPNLNWFVGSIQGNFYQKITGLSPMLEIATWENGPAAQDERRGRVARLCGVAQGRWHCWEGRRRMVARSKGRGRRN